MSFIPQPTNKQTFRCKADSNWEGHKILINARQHGKILRVEFTLTKLQEEYPGQTELETNYSSSQNYNKQETTKIKYLQPFKQIGQAN